MRWYERRGAHLLQPFKDAFKECVNRIAANPHQGAIYQAQFRWQRTKRYPYVLYYHILDDRHVLILASPTAGEGRDISCGEGATSDASA
jgi:hypothetical protein